MLIASLTLLFLLLTLFDAKMLWLVSYLGCFRSLFGVLASDFEGFGGNV